MMELEPTATTFEDFQSRQAAIDALNTEAWACRDADPQRTRDLSLHAQTLAEEAADHGTPYHTGFADALLGQAYANMRLGEHAHAFEQAASARDQYEALSHNERLVEALNILAGTQAYTGLYAEALSTTQTQLALAEQIANPLQTIEAHSNIANLYTLTAQTNLAQEHFTQVVILADSVDDTRARFMARYNFAVALNGFGNHQEALGHARIAEALAVEGASEYLHLLSLGAVGEALLGLGVLGEAQTTLQRSLAGARAANIPFVAAQALIVLGVMAGDTKDGDNALRFLLEALKLSVEHGDPRQQRECYQRLASVYEQQGDCQSALAHANTAHALDRNLFNEAADQRFKLLQVVHATATARRDAESSRRRTAELEHEIAERKKTEAALQRRVSELATLNSVAQGLTFLTTIEETLGKVSPLLAQLFDLGALRVWLHAPSDQTLACLVSWEQHQSSPHPRPITLSEHPLAAHTLTEGQPLVVPSASIDTHLLGLTSPSAHTQALLLPLRARQTVRGLLALCGSAERRIFTPSDVALAQIVAGSLANAIESALLAEQARGTAVEEERRRLARELHDSVSQSLYSATILFGIRIVPL